MTMVERTRTALPRRAVLAMVVGAIGCAGPATPAVAGGLVDLTVVDRETGEPLRVWRHAGHLFVAGEPGARYSLRVTNNTAGRVLVVMSVDGVNVLTGETADYGQRGYVFGPYESYDVSGWRKSDTEVAAFTFASLPQSYAARTGRPFDVGVIGLAAFRERAVAPVEAEGYAPRPEPRPWPDADSATRAPGSAGRRAAPPPAAPPRAALAPAPSDAFSAQRRDEKLGTAHGAREWSEVTEVSFERATRYPQMIRRIEYDTYERLVAAGVTPPSWTPWGPGRRPRPFPGRSGEDGYVPDPPGEY